MQTKGDLAGAIKLFEEVGKSPDRNLVARSLLHLGECRLKLGQQEASKPFERVVREFSDQRDVAAQPRLRDSRRGCGTHHAGAHDRDPRHPCCSSCAITCRTTCSTS